MSDQANDLGCAEMPPDTPVAMTTGQPSSNPQEPEPTFASATESLHTTLEAVVAWSQELQAQNAALLATNEALQRDNASLTAACGLTERMLNEHRQQLEAVRTIAPEVTQKLDLTSLLDLLIKRGVGLFPVGVSSVVYLWEDGIEKLVPRAWYNIGAWVQGIHLRLGEGVAGTIAQQRQGMIVDDYQNSPYTHPVYAAHLGSIRALGEPLLYRDQLIGVAMLMLQDGNNDEETSDFVLRAQELMTLFANHAAIVIMNAQLFEAKEEQTAQLVAANHALRREVEERSHTEAELAKANRELGERNSDLNEFTRAASHDLKEPLRHVMIYSQLLQSQLGESLAEEIAESLDFITGGVERMRAMVEHILSFARVGQVEMEVELVSLDACVDAALQVLGFRIEATGAIIHRHDLPHLMGDASMLTQLYQNLISNALKFVGREPSVVHLTAEYAAGYWTLGVQDNGLGIDPEYVEQIFVPFQRLHSYSEYEGSGIGLATCRRTVERHGGRIWVESVLGQGAHIKFTLPDIKEKRGVA